MNAEESVRLRTIEDIIQAHEWVYNKQKDGKIDAKTADGLNTTLKGMVYLKGKLKIDAAKLYMQAQIKKVSLPPELLPDLSNQP